MYVTPRTLLAIIRLSQAMAKLSFREKVNQADVDEAIKLMDFSIRSLRTLKAENASGSKGRQAVVREFQNNDRMSVIIQVVKQIIQNSGANQMKLGDILKSIGKDRMSALGSVDREELKAVLTHYKKLQVIYLDDDDNVLFI
jgi:DNA replication licensing factor MCM7